MLVWVFVVATVTGCGSEKPEPGTDGDGGNPDGGVLVDGGPTDGNADTGDGSPPGDGSNGCGNGRVTGSEACDDGNNDDLDGCSADCSTVEPGFVCPTPGEPCIALDFCGNGVVNEDEACDDRNDEDGDGCSADCSTVEPGWSCPFPGVRCVAAECGDSIVAGFEECDDGDAEPNDGCSDECKIEEGFACPEPGEACYETTCGDDVAEGLEQCDDGNFDTGDGCSPICTLEPQCSGGMCQAVCGDGLKLASEACDDGNTRNGDGCSASCEVEFGFECELVVESPVLPIVYRDFIGTSGTGSNDAVNGNTGPLHLDFEKYNGCEQDVQTMLDGDGKPALLNRNSPSRSSGNCVESAETFAQWYRSDTSETPVNRTVVDRIVFTPVDGQEGAYLFADNDFYPLTGRGWNDPSDPQEQTRNDHSGTPRNFHFTSELRYWFTYRGGERLTFYGDDDVWVFINGRLAVDIAGVHGRRQRQITLGVPGETTATSENSGTTRTYGYPNANDLDLEDGGIYEVAVFQAERHTSRSQYRLTLENFLTGRSRCQSECGDGKVAADEACDDGVNDGSYGGCLPGCKERAPYCGDAVVQNEHEECDDGLNVGGYNMCGPECVWGPRCGDGVHQPEFGESCDDGNMNDEDSCKNDCTPGVI